MKFVLINLKLLIIANSFLLNVAEHDNFSLINMKMPTIVGISIFVSREISCSAELSMKKVFIILLFLYETYVVVFINSLHAG